jgi:hypothetical protein
MSKRFFSPGNLVLLTVNQNYYCDTLQKQVQDKNIFHKTFVINELIGDVRKILLACNDNRNITL